jgi:cobalt/nickel transport system permease protein
MHMADALLSPAVGGAMWAVSTGAIAYCSRKVREGLDDRKVPLMGVLGAFLFSAQMINFTIPGTGSSGHLGGGLLLTILLGPHAAFLTIASVLLVQALFFADGGILALGCNIFNIGFLPAFVVYPLIYRQTVGTAPGRTRLMASIMVSAVAGLQVGSFAVVLETLLSGISALPFSTFLLLMQPIHLAIGVVEGFVTAAVVAFVHTARPDILQPGLEARPGGTRPMRGVIAAFLVAAVITGGIVSWFASNKPDGLEWAIARVTGKGELKGSEQGVHGMLSAMQERTAFLPDYGFGKPVETARGGARPAAVDKKGTENRLATSLSGIAGGLLTLAAALLTGWLLKRRARSGGDC